MKRRLFNVLTAVSLLLCMAVAWKWYHPKASGGTWRTIAAVRGHSSGLELAEIENGLLIGMIPNDIRQIDSQSPPEDGKPAFGLEDRRHPCARLGPDMEWRTGHRGFCS